MMNQLNYQRLNVEKREKALNLLGLAYRARKLINGDEVVTDNLQKGKCKMVIVARDASSRTIDKFQKKCFFYGTEQIDGQTFNMPQTLCESGFEACYVNRLNVFLKNYSAEAAESH